MQFSPTCPQAVRPRSITYGQLPSVHLATFRTSLPFLAPSTVRLTLCASSCVSPWVVLWHHILPPRCWHSDHVQYVLTTACCSSLCTWRIHACSSRQTHDCFKAQSSQLRTTADLLIVSKYAPGSTCVARARRCSQYFWTCTCSTVSLRYNTGTGEVWATVRFRLSLEA